MRVLVAVAAALLLLPGFVGAAGTAAAAPAGPVVRGVATLNGIVAALNRHGGPAGTAWGVDEVADQVVLYVEAGAAAEPARQLLRYAAGFGDAVRVLRLPAAPAEEDATPPTTAVGRATGEAGTQVTTLRAGDTIWATGLSGPRTCTAGFPVITSNPLPPPPYAANRILTSGWCSSDLPAWYLGSSSGAFVGYTAGSNFPRTDYGVISKASGINAVSAVNLRNGTTRPIYSSGDPFRDRSVCMSGAGSGYRCGRISATNVTVNYGEGSGYDLTVYGLAVAGFCSKSADRGAPVFDGNTAVGLVSRYMGNCTWLPLTYIQPVRPAMQAYGLYFPPAS